jgi:uncharacterized alpha-E superfamily protein
VLSRTADSLFWLARYMERAENVARILSVGQRLSSIASLQPARNEWHSTLVAVGCEPSFFAKHPAATSEAVIDYLVRDPENPSSILTCLQTARSNGRNVRTALTVDMWEVLNDTWLAARSFGPRDFTPDRLAVFLDWVKQRALMFNGAYNATLLRLDGYHFTQLGTFVERADNTARLLDVKYHVLLPEGAGVGGAIDYYQWESILRAASALRAYHFVYHARLQPWLIAELLILRPEMPRSLLSCYGQITRYLERLAERYGGDRGECHRLAGELHARLLYGRTERIFQDGLHEFLTEFIDRTADLGREISDFYLLS